MQENDAVRGLRIYDGRLRAGQCIEWRLGVYTYLYKNAV